MKFASLFIITFLLASRLMAQNQFDFIENSFEYDEDFKMSCSELIDYGNSIVSKMNLKMKQKVDIDSDFFSLEKLVANNKECLSLEKLKLDDKKISQIRKYIYAPDRSFNLKEKDCQEFKVDISDMPLNNNQGPLSWCFAFSAADLLSFYEKKKFSAYDMALTYHINRKDIDDFNKPKDYTDAGGFTESALRESIESTKGICLENELKYNGADWEKLSEMLKNLASPQKNLQQVFCDNYLNAREVFGDMPSNILDILNKLSAEKRASALLDIQCKNRSRPLNKYSIEFLFAYSSKDSDPKELILKLDELLSRGEPAMIAYASELLSSGVHFQGAANHASTVIARKFNKSSGQCEYLIKNSWGSSENCQSTASIRCEKGNYWVPRTALKNNVQELNWLKKMND